MPNQDYQNDHQETSTSLNHDHESGVKHRHPMTAPQGKDRSARIKDEQDFDSVWNGVTTLKKGDTGAPVLRLQQALIDMGFLDSSFADRGTFEDLTVAAVMLFQKGEGLLESGIVDQDTLTAVDARFDTRQDYIDAGAGFDPKNEDEGARKLSKDEKKQAVGELAPQPSVKGASFDPKDAAKYGKEIKSAVLPMVKRLHQELYVDKVGKRKDPKKNLFEGNDLEGAANAGKDVTDTLYGNLAKGPVFKMGVNLIDQWEDEEARNSKLKPKEHLEKAKNSLAYLIDSNCSDIHSKYNASTSGTEEQKVLGPIIDEFLKDPDNVQKMLQIDVGWEGAQLEGTQYLQRYKSPDFEKNRLHMWQLFHTSIHEYIHTLAHPKYNQWAGDLGGAEEHALVEGFCDFFTLNVRAAHPPSKLKSIQPQVEGPFYPKDPKMVPPKPVPPTSQVQGGVYDSNQEAERMVGVIGIKNAQLGYFKGKTELMGK